jgi:hypothetical protein
MVSNMGRKIVDNYNQLKVQLQEKDGGREK